MITRHALAVAFACLVFSPGARAQFQPPADLKVARPEDKQDVKPVPAPAGAKVLFDGTAESLKEIGRESLRDRE
jgi:hypothetical protein